MQRIFIFYIRKLILNVLFRFKNLVSTTLDIFDSAVLCCRNNKKHKKNNTFMSREHVVKCTVVYKEYIEKNIV